GDGTMHLFETASDERAMTGAVRDLGIELSTINHVGVDTSLVELTTACRRLREMQLEFATAIGQLVDHLEWYAQSPSGSTPCPQPSDAASHARSKLARQPAARSAMTPASDAPLAALRVTCFGRFEVRQADKLIAPCHNRNGQTILRYLVAQARHREKGDVLMDVLWPDDAPEVARHKLHC